MNDNDTFIFVIFGEGMLLTFGIWNVLNILYEICSEIMTMELIV